MNVSSIWCSGCYLKMTYLTCLPCSYSNMKRHEIVVEWILSFLFYRFLLLFHLNMNDLRYFFRSLSHDDSTWTNIFFSSSSSSHTLHWKNEFKSNYIFCFYSISRRWLSMLWACHFLHKRENIDRYRKYDTAFSLSLPPTLFFYDRV
jgi:hypothetical protein